MAAQTLYDVFKVSPDAPPEVIGASYRALAKKHHPDTNRGNPAATAMMRQLNAAWETLGNADARRRYDATLVQPRTQADYTVRRVTKDPELARMATQVELQEKAHRLERERVRLAEFDRRRREADAHTQRWMEGRKWRERMILVIGLAVYAAGWIAALGMLRTPGYREYGVGLLIILVGVAAAYDR